MKTTIFLIAMIAASAASGQNRQLKGGFGGFMIGGASEKIGSLNQALTANNYQKFSDRFLTLGGGGFATFNSFIIGGEGHSLAAQEKFSNDLAYRTRLSGHYGLLRVGFVLLSKGPWIVYPMGGFGRGSFSMNIAQRASVTFDNALADPRRSVSMRSQGYIFDAGVGTVYVLSHARRRGWGGFLVGLSAGYAWAPAQNTWTRFGGDIDGGPKALVTGPYVRLMLGGGGFRYDSE